MDAPKTLFKWIAIVVVALRAGLTAGCRLTAAGTGTGVGWTRNGDSSSLALLRWPARLADRIVGIGFDADSDRLKARTDMA